MCPVIGCGLEVINLPRHLQRKPHCWSKQSATAAIGLFKLRTKTRKTKIEQSSTTEKSTRKVSSKPRICPIPTCSKVIKRLPKHLTDHHKMERNKKYYELLRIAPAYDEQYSSVKNAEKSPGSILKKLQSKIQQSIPKSTKPSTKKFIFSAVSTPPITASHESPNNSTENVPVANKVTKIQLQKYDNDPTTITTPQNTNKTYSKHNTITNKNYALLDVDNENEQCSNDSNVVNVPVANKESLTRIQLQINTKI